MSTQGVPTPHDSGMPLTSLERKQLAMQQRVEARATGRSTRKLNAERDAYALRAFDVVMESLQDERSPNDLLTVHNRQANVSTADWRCDVYVAARRVLSVLEYKVFNALTLGFSPDRVPVEVVQHIRLRVGRIWDERRLSNLWSYFNEPAKKEKPCKQAR